MGNYKREVIGLGDNSSDSFEGACKKSNAGTTICKEGLVIDGVIQTSDKMKGVVESIDGVGTKVQIYTNQFENLINEFEDGIKKIKLTNPKFSDEEAEEIMLKKGYNTLLEESSELWEAMFHDLIAMNVDDLRNGEMGVTLTNIIDINSLKGLRGKVFTESLSIAIGKVIENIDIPMTAGETAVLGENQKFMETLGDYIEDRKFLLDMIIEGDLSPKAAEKIKAKIKERRRGLFKRLRKLEFNIGGTAAGVEFVDEKLVEMKAGQRVVALYEKPTEDGIIGPRSNGITKIRETLHNLAGDGWENLSFEEFLEKVGGDVSRVPEELKGELKGLKMWKIATGKSTVFNPLVSRELLGGEKGEPIGNISSFIHITGNPLKKLANGVKDDRLRIDVNITEAKIPQIIELLQILGGISDDEAKDMWNMGAPAAIVCDEKDVEKIIQKAKEQGIDASDIGEITEKDLKDYNTKGTVKGIGIGNTDVEIKDEIDIDLPKLPSRYTNTHSGKVRETYTNPDNPDEMILIATDRISTHDVVHQSLIKGKGAALTQISNFWFKELKNNPETSGIKTHMVDNPIWPEDFPDELKEKAVIVKKLKALPIEAIVRGYLYGSVLGKYDSDTGKLSTGQSVGKGLIKCSKFRVPQFTPSTKSDGGDVNIDFKDMHKELAPWLIENGYVDINPRDLANLVKKYSLEIYKFANEKAGEKGDILGDTKFEFGLDSEGNLTLIDEILTPDSSRFWKKDTFMKGKEPDSSDKQPVRDNAQQTWKARPRIDEKKYPIELGNEIIKKTEISYAKMRIKYT